MADVGAGTGKFMLLATGASVAVEPVDAMRARLAPHERLRVQAGTAEATGLGGSLGAIVCAQASTGSAAAPALDEFARVLKPGGRLGLVWNVRDESVDWVAKLTRIVAPYEGDAPRLEAGLARGVCAPRPRAGARDGVRARTRWLARTGDRRSLLVGQLHRRAAGR